MAARGERNPDSAYRAVRRLTAARHHPDHGGSTEAFIAAMADLERRHRARHTAAEPAVVIGRSVRRRRWRRTIGRLARRRTRYIDL